LSLILVSVLSSFLSLSRHLLFSLLFFFNAPSTTEIYTLSLHDALPILPQTCQIFLETFIRKHPLLLPFHYSGFLKLYYHPSASRSEEHTSELQSRFDLVCRLLLEKKKKNTISLSSINQYVRYSL